MNEEMLAASALLVQSGTPADTCNCPMFKVHKHDIFLIFLAETETLWSQGPVTQDF
jgi:hypothetical protein